MLRLSWEQAVQQSRVEHLRAFLGLICAASGPFEIRCYGVLPESSRKVLPGGTVIPGFLSPKNRNAVREEQFQ